MRAAASASIAIAVLLAAPAVDLRGVSRDASPGRYRSNSIAMALEPLEPGESAEYELEIVREASGPGEMLEERVLTRDGEELRRIVRELEEDRVVVEREWEGERQVSERRFDERGRVAQEVVREHGEVVERIRFVYRDDGRLSERIIERPDEAGNEEGANDGAANGSDDHSGNSASVAEPDGVSFSEHFRERYRYRADGLLRRIERTFADGATGGSEFLFSDSILVEEWHERGAASVLVVYDRIGRLTLTEEHFEDELVVSERLLYPGDDLRRDAEPERREVSEPEHDRITETEFDEAGREIVEHVYEGGERTRQRRFEYDDELLVREVIETDERLEERRYEYDEDGNRTTEKRTVDGVITRRLRFGDGEQVTEERYIDGELALIIERDGEERVREQVIRDGEVVRERTF